MKNRFVSILGVAFLALTTHSVLADGPIRVACLGDSITQGVGAEPGKAYPSQLQAILGDKWEVKNYGLGSRTLLKKGDVPYWREQALKDAQAYQPNVVVIMLGTNDTKAQNWVHSDEFYADYKELAEIFKNLASKPKVFICRPPPVPGIGNYGINEANLQQEISMIDKLAADEQVGLIDMHAALENKPELLPDRVHPNTAGAGIMAQTVADAITKTP